MKKHIFIIFLIFVFCINSGFSQNLLEDNVKNLKSLDTRQRLLAARALGSLQNTKASPFLIDSLKNEKEIQVKIAIINSLGYLKDSSSIKILLEQLFDSNNSEDIIISSILALEYIADKTTLASLKTLLTNKNSKIQCYAAGTLKTLGSNDGFEILSTNLNAANNIKLAAIKNLGKFNNDQAASLILPFLQSKDIQIKKEAVIAAGKIAKPITGKPLTDLLKDKDPVIRTEALKALAQIKYKDAYQDIINIINTEKNTSVLLSAIDVLAIFDSPDTSNILYTLIKNNNIKISQRAIEALSNIKNNSSIDIFIECFYNTSLSNAIRYNCINTAQTMSDKYKKQEIIKAILSQDWMTVEWAENDISALIHFSSHTNPTIRKQAYSSLAKFSIERYWDTIKKGLKDQHTNVKQEIISILGNSDFNLGFQELKRIFKNENLENKEMIIDIFQDKRDTEFLRTAINDPNKYIQMLAAYKLSTLDDKTGLKLALAEIQNPDEDIRDLAFDTLAELKDNDSIATLKSIQKNVPSKELKNRLKLLIKTIKQ